MTDSKEGTVEDMARTVDAACAAMDSAGAAMQAAGAELDRLREENERLRKALWDCAGEAGADLDGNPTPSQSIDVAAFALDAVKDLRQCYDSELRREL